MKKGRPRIPLTSSTRYKVNSNGCWVWKLKHRTHSGFPEVSDKGIPKVATRIFAKEIKDIKVPDGFVLFQKCRNRSCVNPDHLEIISKAESVRRGNASKLIKSEVVIIRRIYANGNCSQSRLSEKYGVSQSQISRIVNYERWINL